MTTARKIAVLCGGVGAARLLRGLVDVVPPESITAIVNTADDLRIHGLHVSPDIDTITYTLADEINPATGWGLAGETWNAMEMVSKYGGLDWFNLGDRDLGTHLFRTHRLAEGATLSEVTDEIAKAWGLHLAILPVTNDAMSTMVTTEDEGEIGFQDYFVRRRHDVAVKAVRFAGAERAEAAPGVLEAIESAETILIAPSNPIVSIAPLFAVEPVREAVRQRRRDVIAVSGILAGKAIKGPADRLLRELGYESSALGVARVYREMIGTLVIDTVDAVLADQVRAEGIECVITETVMKKPQAARRLGETLLSLHRPGRNSAEAQTP